MCILRRSEEKTYLTVAFPEAELIEKESKVVRRDASNLRKRKTHVQVVTPEGFSPTTASAAKFSYPSESLTARVLHEIREARGRDVRGQQTATTRHPSCSGNLQGRSGSKISSPGVRGSGGFDEEVQQL